MALQPRELCIAVPQREKPKEDRQSGCGGEKDRAQMMTAWEPRQCANMESNGGPAVAFYPPGARTSVMARFGRLDLRIIKQSQREKHCKGME